MTRAPEPAHKRRWRRWLLRVVGTAFLAVARPPAAAAGPPPAPPGGEGQPFLQHFSPRDYRAGTQCWCAAQDARGVMYVGNLDVVLEYDGSTWRKVPVGQGNVVTGIAYDDASDRVFVGALNNLGYLQTVPGGGAREFVSLLDQLPADVRNVGRVSGVTATPEGVYFVAGNRVLRWRDGRFRVWQPGAAARLSSAWVAGRFHVQSTETGLLRLENDLFVPASDDPLFRRAAVRGMLPGNGPDGELLVATYEDGLFTMRRDGVARLVEGECGRFLKEKGIYRMRRLRDGSLAVATVSAGLLLLDPAGNFRNRVDNAGGLHGNNILNLFEDAEGGLWVGLQSGITRAEVNSPLSILRAGPEDDLSNTLCGDYWLGCLVLGNYVGLFRVAPADPITMTGAHLERLPGIAETFTSACAVEDGLLLVGTGKVQHFDAAGRLTAVHATDPEVRRVLASRAQPGRVFFNDDAGRIRALRRDPATGRWAPDGTVADTGATGDVELSESPRGDLWLATKERGLLRVRPATTGEPAPPVVASLFDAPDSPLRGVPLVLTSRGDGPLAFSTLDKLFRLTDDGENVRPVTEFVTRFSDGSLRCDAVLSADPGTLWVAGKESGDPTGPGVFGRASAGRGGAPPTFAPLPRKVEDALGEVAAFLPVERAPDPLRTVLITGSTGNGVVRLDVARWEAARREPPAPFATLLRRAVTLNGGGGPTPILTEPLPHARNSVHFEFAAGTLAFGAAPRFQTRLRNFGTGDWSDFSERTGVEYLNLPEGRYVFEVRARDADGRPGTVASLPFRVRPPWHRHPAAYGLYALLAAGGVGALVGWRGRRLRAQNLHLERAIEARTGELRRAVETADGANRAKSAFLANMSHELRTPLNAILGYAQILLKHADLPARGREQVAVIGQSGRHLLALINEVLDLSKIEADQLTLRRSDFSLPQLLDEVGAAFRPRFAEKGLTFTEERAPGLPAAVHADPSRLRQVLFNLLGNAVKFTAAGGVRLEVRPGEEAGRVRFAVTDTGVGIAANELADIFLPFHQTGESRLAAQGTGLGLAISQRLVGLLGGGSIGVESTPGRGSRFWFDLPLPPAEAPDRIAAAAADPSPGRVRGYEGAPRRLLLVDDLGENRRVLRDLLQPLGFEIEEAADGAGALAACAARRPDAVLLDLRLGAAGPDGFEVARTLRIRPPRDAPLGIIAISASVFESDRQQALDAGCDDFLPKPFEEEQLLQTLGRVLGLRWVQAIPPPAAAVVDPTAGDAPPAEEEVRALLELSLRGDIVGLRRRLDALRASATSDGGTAALVRRLEPLVADYQVEAIHALLLALPTTAAPSA